MRENQREAGKGNGFVQLSAVCGQEQGCDQSCGRGREQGGHDREQGGLACGQWGRQVENRENHGCAATQDLFHLCSPVTNLSHHRQIRHHRSQRKNAPARTRIPAKGAQ